MQQQQQLIAGRRFGFVLGLSGTTTSFWHDEQPDKLQRIELRARFSRGSACKVAYKESSGHSSSATRVWVRRAGESAAASRAGPLAIISTCSLDPVRE